MASDYTPRVNGAGIITSLITQCENSDDIKAKIPETAARQTME
jgi:hypothetical protein